MNKQNPTYKMYMNYTKFELQTWCFERELDTTGTKRTLAKRLTEDHEETLSRHWEAISG